MKHFRLSRVLAPAFLVLVIPWLTMGTKMPVAPAVVLLRWSWLLALLGIFVKELWSWSRSK